MTCVFVTGGSGFAGSHLCARLEDMGDEITRFEGDVRDLDSLRDALRAARPESVAHLAAASSVSQAWGDERSVWDINATGTLNLVLAVRDVAAHARVLVVSSAEVYGIVPAERQPIVESEPLAPYSPYGLSKAAADLIAMQSSLDVAVVRPFNHIGPGQDSRFAIASFCAQIARIERSESPPTIKVGNLDARRDLSDVRDVVEAYRLLLAPSGPRGPLNVASGQAHRMGDVLDSLIALASCPIETAIDAQRFRPSDVPLLCGDASRLASATGWAPGFTLARTLADTLDAARRAASA